MKELHGSATALIDASPQAVFDLITDLDRLPAWNRAIEAVTDRPVALEEGSAWTVKMHPPRNPSWGSVSRVEVLDRAQRRLAYETRNTDGNPSYTRWSWEIADHDGASEVRVGWNCYLKTPDRRFLAGPLRKRGLAREVPRSLAALSAALQVTTGS